MPADVLVRTLEAGMIEAGITSAEVVAGDLWELPPERSKPVVDSMLEGHGFPMVLANERVVCVDGVDVQTVVSALRDGDAA